MLTSKVTSKLLAPVAASALGLVLGFGCSDTGSPANGSSGSAGQGNGSGGSAAGTAGSSGSSGSSGSGAASGGAGASAGGASSGAGGANAGAGGANAGAGGSNGGAAGSGAGSGGGGGDAAAAFKPCSTAPAATVPQLKRGPAINGFDGMNTAGQIVGVPGEPGVLYVIGHRNGAVYTVKDGKIEATPLLTASVQNDDREQGILSMALHPSFATNHLFYLFYTASGGGAMTVDEYERNTATTATKKRNIYSRAREAGGSWHNGGSLAFNPKDATPYLYLSVGNNQSNNAGDANAFSGRVLRFDVDSKAVTTYALGLRNPYRMTIDRLTGDMYIADVANGPGGTIIFNANGKSGSDFGYRDNGGNPDVNEGILRDTNGEAIIGGYMYRGNKIPGLCGRYFYGNFKGGIVKSIVVQDGKKVGDTVSHGSLTVPGDLASFGEDGEGELYMASMNNAIYKIEAQ